MSAGLLVDTLVTTRRDEAGWSNGLWSNAGPNKPAQWEISR